MGKLNHRHWTAVRDVDRSEPHIEGYDSAIFLPKPAQPARLFSPADLLELAGIEPDSVATGALIDLNFLEPAFFQRLATLWAAHGP